MFIAVQRKSVEIPIRPRLTALPHNHRKGHETLLYAHLTMLKVLCIICWPRAFGKIHVVEAAPRDSNCPLLLTSDAALQSLFAVTAIRAIALAVKHTSRPL